MKAIMFTVLIGLALGPLPPAGMDTPAPEAGAPTAAPGGFGPGFQFNP